MKAIKKERATVARSEKTKKQTAVARYSVRLSRFQNVQKKLKAGCKTDDCRSVRNITLSIEDDLFEHDLFEQAVAYAKQHHITLEQLIKNLLKEKLDEENLESGRCSRKNIYKF